MNKKNGQNKIVLCFTCNTCKKKKEKTKTRKKKDTQDHPHILKVTSKANF